MKSSLFVLAMFAFAGELRAQTPANGRLAADVITPEALMRHISVIAHDSM
jgi:hypothetical protein